MSDKIIGILICIVSGVFIGLSSVLFKKHFQEHLCSEDNNNENYGLEYTKSRLCKFGIGSLLLGEFLFIISYYFLPISLASTLYAIGIISGNLLSSFACKEKVNTIGKYGINICVIGLIIVVVNSLDSAKVVDLVLLITHVTDPKLTTVVGLYMFILFITLILLSLDLKNYLHIYGVISSSILGAFTIIPVKIIYSVFKVSESSVFFKNPFVYILVLLVIILFTLKMLGMLVALGVRRVDFLFTLYFVLYSGNTIILNSFVFNELPEHTMQKISLICGILTVYNAVYIITNFKGGGYKLLFDQTLPTTTPK